MVGPRSRDRGGVGGERGGVMFEQLQVMLHRVFRISLCALIFQLEVDIK